MRGAVLLAVAIPFADGRSGALVVEGAPTLATRACATQALAELAVECAERPVFGATHGAPRRAGRTRPGRLTAAPHGF